MLLAVTADWQRESLQEGEWGFFVVTTRPSWPGLLLRLASVGEDRAMPSDARVSAFYMGVVPPKVRVWIESLT